MGDLTGSPESTMHQSGQQTVERSKTAGNPGAPEGISDRRRRLFALVVLGLISVATIYVYSPVLFDFFLGDDFVHLTWLPMAVQEPHFIWKNFFSSWLDGTTTRFYRPLISVFMVSDYLIWGNNGLGFHITNLLFHLGATFALYGIVRELRSFDTGEQQQPPVDIWAACAATLFALYPLHPEAVSWITGRVDSVVTAFTLGSLWCYMRWRNHGGNPGFGALAAVFFVLALLSKEMAITLPAVFLAFDAFRHLSSSGSLRRRNITRVIAPSVAFWFLLAAYFMVRKAALGTFVGGYDDSLFFVPDVKHFLLSWAHALGVMLIPFNRELLGFHDPLTRMWQAGLILCAACGVRTLVLSAVARWQALFLISWLGLSLVPVYKIFAITGDLQGSRLAYLATAPLCVLICLMLAGTSPSAIRQRAQALLALGLICLSAAMLWLNNQPWAEAGREANSIRSALKELYTTTIPGDPQVLLLGLPDTVKGAYTCRNALEGMLRRPQLHRDVFNCLAVNPFEPILPFGYLKESLAREAGSVSVFRWNRQTRRFEPVSIPQARLDQPLDVPIKTAVDRESVTGGHASRNGNLTIEPAAGARSVDILLRFPPISSWATEFIEVRLRTDRPWKASANLLYANSAEPGFELRRRAHHSGSEPANKHRLLFALRGLPDWSFGGEAERFLLKLPATHTYTIEAITVVPAAHLIPRLSFPGSGYLGSKGYLHLRADRPQEILSVDISGIEGAASAEAEITRANLLFEEQNAASPSSMASRTIPFGPDGTLILNKQDFRAAGIYQLRARARDSVGRPIGLTSDHIVIAIAP